MVIACHPQRPHHNRQRRHLLLPHRRRLDLLALLVDHNGIVIQRLLTRIFTHEHLHHSGTEPAHERDALPLRLDRHRLELTSEIPIHDIGHIVPSLGISAHDHVLVRLPLAHVLPRTVRGVELHVREMKSRRTMFSRGTRCRTASGSSKRMNTACRSVFIPQWLRTIAVAFAASPAPSWSVTISGSAENVTKTFAKGGLASCESVIDSATTGRMGWGSPGQSQSMSPIEPETSQMARQLSSVPASRSRAIIASHCASTTCASRLAMCARRTDASEDSPFLLCLKRRGVSALASSSCGRSVAPEIFALPAATLSK